ncbi:MAG: RluA family pseudouridine synthase, partial [Firmicutes bacterium]|nr:RluA family pseudouridine synthase [Bacillota bacterium]
MEKRWIVGPEGAGQRLDLFLAAVGAGPSRTAIQKAIAAGLATINGRPARPAQIVNPGDEVVLGELQIAPAAAEPEEIPLRVVYEDADLLVVDKPRGMVVHPAPGNTRGTLVNALLAHAHDLSGIGGALRPGIVHRLDKDTTGLLVVAKNDRTHLALSEQLKERVMSRSYLAIVHGVPAMARGIVEMPIGRHPFDRKRMAVVAGGRPAMTEYRVLEDLGAYSLLKLRLGTGRTHQI